MKKVRLKCSECQKILQLNVKPEDADKTVTVKCTCGQKLRTQLPVADAKSSSEQALNNLFGEIFGKSRIF